MILIASHSTEILSRVSRAAESLALVNCVNDVTKLRANIEKTKPRLVLLDIHLPGIDAPKGILELQRLSIDTRIIVIGSPNCDDAELALFRYGVRGCCPADSNDEHYQRVIAAVLRGEVWIRRSLTLQLLEQLSGRMRNANSTQKTSLPTLSELTKREREIANLVADGESNKIIARKLAIAERTVKAHLTEVFRKLGVSDRLKLAVLLSADVDAFN